MDTKKIFNENRLIFESLESPKDNPQVSPEKRLQISLDGLKDNLTSQEELNLAQVIADALNKIPDFVNENINSADIFKALYFDPGKFNVDLSTQEEQKSAKILRFLHKGISDGSIKGIKLVFLGGTDSTRHLMKNKSEDWHNAKKDAFNKLINLSKANRLAPPNIQAKLTDSATVNLINEYISANDPNKFMKDHSNDFLPGGALFDIALAFQRAEQLKNHLDFENDESEINEKDFIYLDINKNNQGRAYRKASVRLVANGDKLETSPAVANTKIPMTDQSQNVVSPSNSPTPISTSDNTSGENSVNEDELPDDSDPDVVGPALTEDNSEDNQSSSEEVVASTENEISYAPVPIPRLNKNTPEAARETAQNLIGTNTDEARDAINDSEPDESMIIKPKTGNGTLPPVDFVPDEVEGEDEEDETEEDDESNDKPLDTFDLGKRSQYMEYVSNALDELNFDTNTWDFDDSDDIQALSEFIVNECQKLDLDPLKIDIKNIPGLLVDGEVVFDVDEKLPNQTGTDALFSKKNAPVLAAIKAHLDSLEEADKPVQKKGKKKTKQNSKPTKKTPDRSPEDVIEKFDLGKRSQYMEYVSNALDELNFDTNTWDFDDSDDIQALSEFIVNECQKLDLDPLKIDIKNIPGLLVDGEVVFDVDEKLPNQTGTDALFSKKNAPVLAAIKAHLDSLEEAEWDKI